MKPRYKILLVKDNTFDKLKGLVSMCYKGDYVIIARYGVNKTTLKKILNAYLKRNS